MTQEDGFFQGKKVNSRKLQAYGFKENGGVYSYVSKRSHQLYPRYVSR